MRVREKYQEYYFVDVPEATKNDEVNVHGVRLQ